MKNYLHKVFFALAVFLVCFGITLPLRATEQSVMNDPLLKEYTEMARIKFFQIHADVWSRNQLDKQAAESVKKSVASHTEKLLFGTRTIQLCFNIGGVLDAIREDALIDFRPHYEEFIAGMLKEFNGAWAPMPQDAYRIMAADLIEKKKDPVSQIFLSSLAESMLADNGEEINKQISEALPDGIKLDISAVSEKAPQIKAIGFSGLFQIFSGKSIQTRIAEELSVKLDDYFAREAINLYWEKLVEDIGKGLSVVLSDREILLSELEEFVADPKVQELLKESQQNLEGTRDRAAELVEKYFFEP